MGYLLLALGVALAVGRRRGAAGSSSSSSTSGSTSTSNVARPHATQTLDAQYQAGLKALGVAGVPANQLPDDLKRLVASATQPGTDRQAIAEQLANYARGQEAIDPNNPINAEILKLAAGLMSGVPIIGQALAAALSQEAAAAKAKLQATAQAKAAQDAAAKKAAAIVQAQNRARLEKARRTARDSGQTTALATGSHTVTVVGPTGETTIDSGGLPAEQVAHQYNELK